MCSAMPPKGWGEIALTCEWSDQVRAGSRTGREPDRGWDNHSPSGVGNHVKGMASNEDPQHGKEGASLVSYSATGSTERSGRSKRTRATAKATESSTRLLTKGAKTSRLRISTILGKPTARTGARCHRRGGATKNRASTKRRSLPKTTSTKRGRLRSCWGWRQTKH